MRLVGRIALNAICLTTAVVSLAVDLRGGELLPTDIVLADLLNATVGQLVQNLSEADTAVLNVAMHPDAEYVEAIVNHALHNNNVILKTTSAPVAINVVIIDMATRYISVSDDSVMREVVVSLSATITRNGILTPVVLTSQKRTDRCLRHEAKAAESMQHSSTHGELPAENRTFWDDVLEPAIFIAAAATTVVLLFTVRSK